GGRKGSRDPRGPGPGTGAARGGAGRGAGNPGGDPGAWRCRKPVAVPDRAEVPRSARGDRDGRRQARVSAVRGQRRDGGARRHQRDAAAAPFPATSKVGRVGPMGGVSRFALMLLLTASAVDAQPPAVGMVESPNVKVLTGLTVPQFELEMQLMTTA